MGRNTQQGGQIRSRSPQLAAVCSFRSFHEEGVTGVAQEAVDLLRSGSTHAASLLYGFSRAEQMRRQDVTLAASPAAPPHKQPSLTYL